MSNYYQDTDKSFIVDKAKEIIKTRNEYTSIQYAINESRLGKDFKDEGHKREFFKAIAAQLTNSGEFIKEKSGEIDYEIYKNPQYNQVQLATWIAFGSLLVSAAAFFRTCG